MTTRLDPYLFFDGTAAAAMRFYAEIFGGKIEMMMTQADAPPGQGMPPGSPDRIMHASVSFDGHLLMASDSMQGQPVGAMQGASLSLSYPDVAEANRVFDALAAGGKVTMPMGKTFWVEAFGMCTDRFGIAWMVNGGQPAKFD